MAFWARKLLAPSCSRNLIFNRFEFQFQQTLHKLKLDPDQTEIGENEFVGKSQLHYLDLSESELNFIHPTAFEPLKNLEVLVLGPKNNLNPAIFEAINRIPSLKKLYLSTAKLDELPPGALSNLVNLRELHMSANNLNVILRGMFDGLHNLEELDLRANEIEEIQPEAFGPLKKLKELHIGGNFLSETDPDMLRGLENLEKLDMGWNVFQEIASEAFREVPALKDLSLRHDESLTEARPESFVGLKNLDKLNLSQTNIREFPGHILWHLPNLRYLNLSETQIHDFPTHAAVKYTPKLQELDLKGTKVFRVFKTFTVNK